MIYRQSIIRAAIFIIASELAFATMGAIIKWVSVGLPNEMIVFFRNFFGLAALTPLLVNGGVKLIKTNVFPWHLLRGVSGVAAMYCFFYALGNIKLADVMLLKLTVPIIIPIIAFFWLQEKLHFVARLAGFIGFLGVFFILKPGGDFSPTMLIALTGSFMNALALVTVRKLSATEPAVRTVFYFSIISVVISAIPLIWTWQNPTMNEWLLLLILGLLATLFQLLMTRGYAAAPASQVGIFSYSSVIFGGFIGWWFWGEQWDILSIIGAILITLAGALILRASGD